MQRGDQRNEIQVAAALAVPVDGPLHMDAPGAHGRECVRHRERAVVVGVNAKRGVELRTHVADSLPDHIGQLAPVGIAQHDTVRPGFGRRGERRHGVARVQAIAVEKVFGIVDNLSTFTLQITHRVADHAQIFFQRRTQHLGDV